MREAYLTMAEIEAKYLNEWVLLTDAKVNRRNELVGGRVVYHNADRVAFLHHMGEGDEPFGTLAAIQYIGSSRKNRMSSFPLNLKSHEEIPRSTSSGDARNSNRFVSGLGRIPRKERR